MSEDIQMFLSTGGFRKNRALGKAPLVLPSPNSVSTPGKPFRASSISRPRSTLVPASNRNTVSKDVTAARAKHKNHRSFPQHSMSLDPLMYTGHAELRGETSRNRPRGNVSQTILRPAETKVEFSGIFCHRACPPISVKSSG